MVYNFNWNIAVCEYLGPSGMRMGNGKGSTVGIFIVYTVLPNIVRVSIFLNVIFHALMERFVIIIIFY